MHGTVETVSAMSRGLLVGFALVTILSMCSCGSTDAPPKSDPFEDRLKIDTLYLTEDGREKIKPGNRFEVIVDPETNELAWAAWQCNNPDCPGKGKGKNGRPFLFAQPSPFIFAQGDGTVGLRHPETQEDLKLFEKHGERVCPACLKVRNREAETVEQRQQYEQWCQRYLLPEAAAQLQQIEEKRRRRAEEIERRRKRRPGAPG